MLGREVLKTVISLFPVIQQVLTAVIVLKSMFKKRNTMESTGL